MAGRGWLLTTYLLTLPGWLTKMQPPIFATESQRAREQTARAPIHPFMHGDDDPDFGDYDDDAAFAGGGGAGSGSATTTTTLGGVVAAGPVRFPGQMKLADRQAAGQDEGSIAADPGFADPAAGDFTLAADSPVRGLGFTPLDPAAAGRRTPRRLTADLPSVPTSWPEARSAPGTK